MPEEIKTAANEDGATSGLAPAHGSPLSELETIQTLEWVGWGMHHFSGLAAGSHREELEALAKVGLVSCEGMHPVCDDDGFLKDPEEYDDLYILTDAGRAVLAADKARRDKLWAAAQANTKLRDAP